MTYPVIVPYSVSGTAATDGSDHDLVDGIITIESPALEKTVSINLVDDGAGERGAGGEAAAAMSGVEFD